MDDKGERWEAEPAGDGAAVGDVMSSIGTAPVKSHAISPINGVILPATADTAARARAGRAAKRERYRLAAEAGLLTAAQAVAVGVMSHEQAWQKIVEAQTELALAPDARGSTNAAALVGKAVGALGDKIERDSSDRGDSGDLTQLLALFGQWKAANPGAAAALLDAGADDGA